MRRRRARAIRAPVTPGDRRDRPIIEVQDSGPTAPPRTARGQPRMSSEIDEEAQPPPQTRAKMSDESSSSEDDGRPTHFMLLPAEEKRKIYLQLRRSGVQMQYICSKRSTTMPMSHTGRCGTREARRQKAKQASNAASVPCPSNDAVTVVCGTLGSPVWRAVLPKACHGGGGVCAAHGNQEPGYL